MLRLRSGKVYVIDNNEGLVKIGKATNPDLRCRELQRCAPHKESVLEVAYTTTDRPDVSVIETLAHSYLASQRQFGEWFNATIDEAIQAIEWAIRNKTKTLEKRASDREDKKKKWRDIGLSRLLGEDTTKTLDALRLTEGGRPSQIEMVRRLILQEVRKRKIRF